MKPSGRVKCFAGETKWPGQPCRLQGDFGALQLLNQCFSSGNLLLCGFNTQALAEDRSIQVFIMGPQNLLAYFGVSGGTTPTELAGTFGLSSYQIAVSVGFCV